MTQTPSQEYLNSIFEYRDGDLYWKASRQGIKAGAKAGSKKSNGYISVGLNNHTYGAHRLIFMMFNGYMPIEVDHDDNNPLNNKIENLRNSNSITNQWNRPIQKNNSSGYKNVYWDKNSMKWRVELRASGKKFKVGSFDDLELADLVAQEARNKYHKGFANHG